MTLRPRISASWCPFVFTLITALAMACSDGGDSPTEPPTPVPTTVVVTPSSANLDALGATTQLSAQVQDQDGEVMTGASVSWQSSDAQVAEVSSSTGLVTAQGVGTATMTASAGSASGSATVNVQQVVAQVSTEGGDSQTGYLEEALPESVVVRVVDSGGNPIPGVNVSFTVQSGGGSVQASSVTTGSDGTAATSWILGPTEGTQTLRASAGGVSTSFSATGEVRPARYAVLVYMAADNSLSVPGIKDIDEMESVGSTDEVKVVVQAEFSPEEMELIGCTSGCFNRPNYNTFRYEVQTGSSVSGPDGPVTDIGNRNMTDPAELADFITWATESYPAENYVLVLWNHGGGYLGLLEDQTSAEGLMSLSELRTGLELGGTRFSIIDFDMCLMGGVETAVSVQGWTDYVVFSEETEPGDGNPYDEILSDLAADPTQTSSEAAGMFAIEFVTSYGGSRNAVTKSAVDMSQLPSVVSAWDALGAELESNLSTYQTALAESFSGVQSYSYSFLKDLNDWLSSFMITLASQTPAGADQNPPALAASDLALDLRTAVHDAVIANAHQSPSGDWGDPVDGSEGLSVLLPSTSSSDQLPSTGPGSLGSYQALYPDRAWTDFLTAWTETLETLLVLDQGATPLEVALVWQEEAVAAQADLDLWVLEPSGDLFIPYLGVVTPNGVLSGESYPDTYYELYRTRQYVERGVYYFFGDLWTDPQDFRPLANVASRFGSEAEWDWLYEEENLTFSMEDSWVDDDDFDWSRVIDGFYTDLQYVAYWDISPDQGPEGVRLVTRAPVEGRRAGPGKAQRERRAGPVSSPSLTPEQRNFLSRLRTDADLQSTREERRKEARKRQEASGGSPVPQVRVSGSGGRWP